MFWYLRKESIVVAGRVTYTVMIKSDLRRRSCLGLYVDVSHFEARTVISNLSRYTLDTSAIAAALVLSHN